jgi:alanine racemase
MRDDFVAWAEVDLDAIAHNVAAIKRHVGDRVTVIAVVKANGYGHGMEAAARTALQNGASWLALNHVSPAIALRRRGIQAPILLLGYLPPAVAPSVVEHDLRPALTTWELAQALSAAAQAAGKEVPYHVKVDTGMGRFGLMPAEVVEFVRALSRLPGLRLEGVFTHFACADWADGCWVDRQLALYHDVLQELQSAGITVPMRHVANSAATLARPDTHLDAVRVGIALYGLHPSLQVAPCIPLRPALTLKSRVAQVRTLPPGSGISYGRTYVTPNTARMALVPCGYGDGLMRIISNRGAVLIRGQRAPIRGRVTMDTMVAEVTHIPDVCVGDEVVIIGRQGDDVISAEEVAAWAETINYEVVTHLLPRLPRVYRRDGRVVAVSEELFAEGLFSSELSPV